MIALRSVYRGRLLGAYAGWLLQETDAHLVIGIVPGAETIQLHGGRTDIIRDVAAGRERNRRIPWQRNRVVWIAPFDGAYMLGLFWTDATDAFLGYYVNLQAPLRRNGDGAFDSLDHVLDIVVQPDLSWRWKDEDEFALATELGVFSAREAEEIRAEGERVIARLAELIPTGWENWRPDPAWPLASLVLPEDPR